MKPVQMVAVVLIAHTMAGCSGSSIGGPSGLNGTVTPIPSDVPKTPKPTISMISPNTGSIYGGGWVTVVGEFDPSATATIGGIQVGMGSPYADTNHVLISPPHAAGLVDIVVTNPDGASQTAVGGYLYVVPRSLDLDGVWYGAVLDDTDSSVEFTVRDQVLTSVRCTEGANRPVEVALSQPVVNGKVDFVGDAGRFSAWVAFASQTAGTIDIAPCSGGRPWVASRRLQ